MTREEAIEFIEQVGTDLGFIDIELVVNKIFNDYEAVIKEKDEEIERLKAELNSAFIRDLKSIKMSSNGKHATWEMLKDNQ